MLPFVPRLSSNHLLPYQTSRSDVTGQDSLKQLIPLYAASTTTQITFGAEHFAISDITLGEPLFIDKIYMRAIFSAIFR